MPFLLFAPALSALLASRGLLDAGVDLGTKIPQQVMASVASRIDERWTVLLTPERCEVTPVHSEDADCYFKASTELFLDVWNGRHTPSLADFMSGRIKSNNPLMLREFVSAFGK
mgnify:CR=1 FL=1